MIRGQKILDSDLFVLFNNIEYQKFQFLRVFELDISKYTLASPFS